MKLIIVLVVLGLRRLDIDWPAWLRDNAMQRHLMQSDGSAEGAEWLLKVFLPGVLVALVMYWMQHLLWGLPSLVLGLLLLLWLLGVDSEFRQLDELIVRARMNDAEHFSGVAAEHFGCPGQPGDAGYFSSLLRAISVREATSLFAVLFYLITLGYGFALFYVINSWLARRAHQPNGWAQQWHDAMLWLPSRLLVLALALGGDFRRVMEAVDGRVWQHGNNAQLFVDAIEAARDSDDVADDAEVVELVEGLEDLQALLLRVLAIWLIFAAFWVVLAG